jgi:predicted amidohydrolase YtcJ
MARTTTAGLLALAALVGCAVMTPDGPDRRVLVIENCRLLGHPEATCVLLKDGKVAHVGGDPGFPPNVATLDAKGGLVLAGFHDAHVHLLASGLEKEGVALGDFTTLDAVLAAVGSFARAHPDAPWIQGSGWAYSIVPRGTFPSRHDLDSVVPDRPVVLSSFDGHTTWASSKALALAGVDAKTEDPPGGKIVREPDGSPQGTLLEDAGGLVSRVVPEPSRSAKLAALERALGELVALGVTAIDDIETSEETLELLHQLEGKDALPLRVRVALPLAGDLEQYRRLRTRYASPLLRFGFLKGFVDGVVESKTAYLLEPYAGSKERGAPTLPPERLDPLVARAHAAGFPVALHAIGDAAVRISLDAFEKAIAARPDVRLPHRVEHIEVLAPADAPRFAKLGVTASMQPYHALPEPPTEVWSTNLGPERLPWTFAWRSLLDAKATLVFGSDWPVASPNPLLGLAVAATRRDREGNPPGGWNAHQAISIEEALRAYSSGPLEVGAAADLVILSSSVDLAKPATLWAGRVEATFVAGRMRHPR